MPSIITLHGIALSMSLRRDLRRRTKSNGKSLNWGANGYAMIRQLIQAKGSISQTDKEDIETVISIADADELDAILLPRFRSRRMGFVAFINEA